MRPVHKKTLATEAEKALRESIRRGQFRGVLPGLRVLAQALGVSAPTVATAVKRLTEEGWLVAEGEKKRVRVNEEVIVGEEVVERVAVGKGVVWFATPGGEWSSLEDAERGFAMFLESLVGEDWEVRHRMLGYSHSESRARQWDQMWEVEKPVAMVAWTGRPSLAQWAGSRGLRTLFIGGAVDREDVVMLAVRTSTLAKEALEKCLEHGHRRFCLPLFNRPRSLRAAVRKQMRAMCLERGVKWEPEWMTPESDYDGPEVLEALVARVHAEQQPTVWMFLDWREYLAASCVFRDLGVKVPEDVSVILFSYDRDMKWYRPKLAHFEAPVEKMMKAAADWLRQADTRLEVERRREFHAQWVEGESLKRLSVG